MPDVPPAAEPEAVITVVTGREGPVNANEPVTCSYCGNRIVLDADHSPDCCWRPGKAVPR